MYVEFILYTYSGLNDSTFKKYVTTVYWASASSTTVGYGDIIPYTDFEVILIRQDPKQ